jgi:DNA-binding transcriptional LysR family regulator
MDFKQYEYVLTIAEEKNFSRAAKRLFISQPSLSQYINRLETQLGVTLFDRTVTPLALTYAGELYIETANKIIALSNQLQKKYADISQLKTGRLNIGLTPSKANTPLPMILPVFKNKYPNIDLIITEGSSDELEEMLTKGIVDVCMLNLPIQNSDIEYEEILDEKILLAAPPSFTDYEQTFNGNYPEIDIKKLKDENFILLKPNQRLRQISNMIFGKAGIKPKIILETRSIETSLRLCSVGMGFCFVPETAVLNSRLENSPKLFVVNNPPLIWTLTIAYRKNSYHTKASLAFAEIAKQVLKPM